MGPIALLGQGVLIILHDHLISKPPWVIVPLNKSVHYSTQLPYTLAENLAAAVLLPSLVFNRSFSFLLSDAEGQE